MCAAFADDYAALARGCLDFYEATFEITYLQWAEQLCDALNQFWDETAAVISIRFPIPTFDSHEEDYDGAEPSANSLATECESAIWRGLLERDDLRSKAEQR
jgi:uncharacterized protein YyaL (SSP411 family)